MNIKELIKEVENLIDDCPNWKDCECENAIQLQAIRKKVEEVDNITGFEITWFDLKDWQTLKRLLGVK